jgi:uncharacterized membrane protein YsdA (DUF1294 family)
MTARRRPARAARMPPREARPRASGAALLALAAFAIGYASVALVRGVPAWVDGLYAGASALCFVLHAIDKRAAIQGRGRIPESTLLWLSLAGGWPGAIVAQQALRHKTSKPSFRARFWASVAANASLFAWLASGAGPA